MGHTILFEQTSQLISYQRSNIPKRFKSNSARPLSPLGRHFAETYVWGNLFAKKKKHDKLTLPSCNEN